MGIRLLNKYQIMIKYGLLAIFLCLTYFSSAQNVKIINKDFDIEEFNSVSFDLYGETLYEPWEADYVLVETTAKIWDTPKHLFQDHINKGRYYCHIKGAGGNAKIASIPVERLKLSNRESVVSIVYYPASFRVLDSKIVRQNEQLSSKEEKK